MRIGFQINNISDPPNDLPSVARWAEMRIEPADLALPLDDFIERYVRPAVTQCWREFHEMASAVKELEK